MAALEGPAKEVLLRARAGDRDAFGRIVDAWQVRIFNLAYRMTFDRETACDLTQEVFLHLFRQLDRYDPERPFAPWFLRVATNLCINRTQKAELPTISLEALGSGRDEESGFDPGTDDDPVTVHLGHQSRREAVQAAIRKLPAEYRAILTLHYLEQMPYEELCATLDLPLGTVKNRLHRARTVLKRLLEPLLTSL
ncbi:MAG: sigma-70 family RNA polymerase sigma factor [Planctomycetes bacterium]|nr:sigma-70 family RNA polymerase sigma factor [Planctomycetota bacterium]